MCADVTPKETTTVIDIRHDNTYEIIKIDENCWMRDDLRLDPTNINTNITASNTNASEEAIYNYFNGGNLNNNENWTSTPVSNPDDSVFPNTFAKPYIHIIDNTIYYNYCAISVGTLCSDNNLVAQLISDDLCPANWNMPDSSDYYSIVSLSRRSLNLGLSGSYNYGLSYENYYGVYWTSRVSNGSQQAEAICNDRRGGNYGGCIGGLSSTYRYNGNTVRCVIVP
jgi:uncharacterized protein (TIGR02145 family)